MPSVTTLTREELYELVWSEPISKLAERFDISGPGLAKRCRRHDIPVPERGYWARLKAGKHPPRRPLPPRGHGMPEHVSVVGSHHGHYAPRISDQALLAMELPPPPVFLESIEDLRDRVQKLVGRIARPGNLSSAHATIARLLEEDEARLERHRTQRYPSVFDQPLFVSPLARRRLRIANALFLALSRAGMRCSIAGKIPDAFTVNVGEQYISFTIDLPGKGRRDRYEHQRHPLEGPATQKLELTIGSGSDYEGVRRRWVDGDKRIEDCLADIAVNVIVLGELQYRANIRHQHDWLVERQQALRDEIERQRLERLRRERERQARIEQARIDRLLNEASALRQANEIRQYVRDVQSAFDENGSDTHLPLEQWAAWALAQADRIDPVRTKRFLDPDPELTDEEP